MAPTNPKKTAAQRLGPTDSFRIRAAAMVMNTGAAKLRAVAVATGTIDSELNHVRMAKAPMMPRNVCSQG